MIESVPLQRLGLTGGEVERDLVLGALSLVGDDADGNEDADADDGADADGNEDADADAYDAGDDADDGGDGDAAASDDASSGTTVRCHAHDYADADADDGADDGADSSDDADDGADSSDGTDGADADDGADDDCAIACVPRLGRIRGNRRRGGGLRRRVRRWGRLGWGGRRDGDELVAGHRLKACQLAGLDDQWGRLSRLSPPVHCEVKQALDLARHR